MKVRLAVFLMVVALVVAQVSVEAAKPSYPDKPIEMVVPFGAGGGSDIMARSLVKVITDNKFASVPIIVTNKPGGSGSIGYSFVAEKKGDPYYIATVSSSFYTAPLIGQSPVSYKDFTPIAGFAMDTLVLLVNSNSKYRSLKELLDDARANPKKISVGGTSGTSDDAVITHMMEGRAGLKFKYVPFSGGGDVMTALLGGHVDFAWANPGEALTQMEAGKARPLGVATKTRIPSLPNVPTLKEQGLDVVLAQFRGVVAPKGIPQEAAKYLEEVFRKVSLSPDWQEGYIKKNMVTSQFMEAEEFGKAIVEVTEMYRAVFLELGLIK
ncbi:MAG: tripartite tricarboxylate transporter substrate binding protein [Syntrophothermus sp.]